MAKFLYTISNHARVIVDKDGDLPYSVKSWLESHKFWDVKELEFTEKLLSIIGFKCKLSFFYVYEFLDCTGTVCFTSSASSDEEAKKLLFHIVPSRYITHLKNPQHSDDARKVITKYQNNQTF